MDNSEPIKKKRGRPPKVKPAPTILMDNPVEKPEVKTEPKDDRPSFYRRGDCKPFTRQDQTRSNAK